MPDWGSLATIALLSTALITITLYLWGAKVIPERPVLIPYGDVARLPVELAAPSNIRAGERLGSTPSAAVTQTEGTSVTHSGGGP